MHFARGVRDVRAEDGAAAELMALLAEVRSLGGDECDACASEFVNPHACVVLAALQPHKNAQCTLEAARSATPCGEERRYRVKVLGTEPTALASREYLHPFKPHLW
jgi:hypothetical protein